jgi:two-component system sensor histidine kinase PhoQ
VKINSLSFRLSISTTFILTAFFYLVAFVLEQSFRESAEQVLKEKLQIHIYSLLSEAELTPEGGLNIPDSLREPRFSNPASGLYATIKQADGALTWRSESAVGLDISSPSLLAPGTSVFLNDNAGMFLLNYAVIWEHGKGREQYYIFTVAEEDQYVTGQVDRFKTTLRSWLTFIGLLLVSIQFLVLRWLLKPLRLIGDDLEKIEAGRKSWLDGQYPSELVGLTGNLNKLITSERAHLERYRNTLADLAHSLKTPLAILTGCIESTTVDRDTAGEQILRMNEIVEYQLQKAAAKGQGQLTGEIEVSEIVDKIIVSLKKVYCDKQINFSFDRPSACLMYYEEGDIYEIAGNLLDNASKWCKKNVSISLKTLNKNVNIPCSVVLEIEDDGPGIPKEKLNAILQRGIRADENIQGHGIGMAVVNELIELMNGKLVAGKSEKLGGMKWKVYLP